MPRADTGRSNQIYGELRDSLHITGYAFERACERLEALLAGEQWKQVAPGFANINAFLASLDLDKFQATLEQKKRIAKRIKELQPAASNRQIARTVKVNHDTVDRVVGGHPPRHKKNGSNSNAPTNGAGGFQPRALSGSAAAQLVRRREAYKERSAAAARREHAVAGEGRIECRRGDFRSALDDLHDIDAVITDPPYGRDYLPLLRELAAFADRVLKPDGILAVLYGQMFLPEAFAQMTGFRPYRWTACYLMNGNASSVSHPRAVHSSWKPLLVYGGNQPRLMNDVFKSAGSDGGVSKARHPWGQDLGLFQSIIGALTVPGATIVDPFAGGGTTLLAAKSMGRNAIGCEIDPAAAVFELETAARGVASGTSP